MKKLFLMAGMIGISMFAMAYSGPTILLHHKGNVTVFETDTLQKAIDAAEDGDTIYLNKGNFYGSTRNPYSFAPLIISKSLTIKGVGQESIMRGDLQIKAPQGETFTDDFLFLLEAVKIEGAFYVYSPVSNVTVRKCYFSSGFSISDEKVSQNVHDFLFDRCYLHTLFYLKSAYNMQFRNCVIETSTSSSENSNSNVSFINCYVHGGRSSGYSYSEHSPIAGNQSRVLNSIIATSVAGNKEVTYSYVLANFNFSNYEYNQAFNCYDYDIYGTDTSTNILSKKWDDVDFLTENGFLGNDGTVVGPMGGQTPYTLEPELPVVVESSTRLDMDSKKFKVTLTVSPKKQ